MQHRKVWSVVGLVVLLAVAAPASAQHGYMSSAGHDKDIVETAIAAGPFKTLVAALRAADLVETLSSEGPFTVFAPTDEAFAKLPEGTVEELLERENRDQLVAILTYHVVPGRYLAEDVAGRSSATTAQGQKIRISVKNGEVRIDEARVVQADILASNGVIHVIDTVILPEK